MVMFTNVRREGSVKRMPVGGLAEGAKRWIVKTGKGSRVQVLVMFVDQGAFRGVSAGFEEQ